MLNGAIIGIYYQHPIGKEFIETFYKWALTRDIIAPPGSSRANHRQDQSCLTLLMHHLADTHKFQVVSHNPSTMIRVHCDID